MIITPILYSPLNAEAVEPVNPLISPLKQITAYSIPLGDVSCKEKTPIAVIRNSGDSTGCFTVESSKKIIEYGWGKEHPSCVDEKGNRNNRIVLVSEKQHYKLGENIILHFKNCGTKFQQYKYAYDVNIYNRSDKLLTNSCFYEGIGLDMEGWIPTINLWPNSVIQHSLAVCINSTLVESGEYRIQPDVNFPDIYTIYVEK